MHNGSGYDYVFLINAFSKLTECGLLKSVNIIPKSSNKFLSIILNENILLLDSYCFTNASLGKLSDTLLKSGKEKFKAVHGIFGPKHADLLLRGKGNKTSLQKPRLEIIINFCRCLSIHFNEVRGRF